MSLQPGVRLGVFEILGPLGAGGMGEVYRARDTRLGREVAIKVLPAAFSGDPRRVARFEREARLLASINHPAIAAIYGAEEEGDIRYLAMELVPGETLASLLSRGPIPLEESLRICRQIADGLEAAHEKGVVHRDLKPANIKVTPDGRVKILDLGLAKALELPASDEGLSESPTRTLDQTRPGTILGTVEFMSPEQARGKDVDKRTDIWAFGCVLFEMLSGRRAFTGETASDILASILTKEPDWSALPPATPPRVRELLAHCLQKNANERLRDIGDARSGLERSAEFLPGEAPTTTPPRRVGRNAAVVVALIVAAGLLGYLLLRPREMPPGLAASDRSIVVLPAKVISDFPGGQVIGDGLVETLSARLNDVPGIQVVTPTAAVAASDKNADPFGAARSVGAHLVVRPSIMRDGDRVRIIYLVWNVQSRVQVAAGTIDGSASDLFGIQAQVAEHMASQLKLPMPAKKTPTPIGLETASQQMRYIQALGLLQRYDRSASIEEAIRLLDALVAESPNAALAHAVLARASLLKYTLTRDPSLAERAAKESVRAQQLDPDRPEVYATVGEVHLRMGEPTDAVKAFQQALAAQPNNFDALLGLARSYDAAGDAKRAEESYRRAIALQPSYFGGYSKLAGFFFFQGRYREAVEMFRRVTQLAPDSARAFGNLGGAYEMAGELEKAAEAYQKSLALEPTTLAYTNAGSSEYFLGHFREAATL
ncbi:MAG TPA: protein kinase, partial [Thermoanaerobaculia bacterium]|nr:protein kinase [Thermoanaerobaculia bacterium]